MSSYCISGITIGSVFSTNTYQQPMCVTAYTYSSSGTSMSWMETDEEKIKRVRKEKRGLRNKKLERIYGRVQEEQNSRYLENNDG